MSRYTLHAEPEHKRALTVRFCPFVRHVVYKFSHAHHSSCAAGVLAWACGVRALAFWHST